MSEQPAVSGASNVPAPPARVVVSWSSGKDSALTLRDAQRAEGAEVVGLVTTVNRNADRVAMHAVRRELVEAQAEHLGLPLRLVDLPSPCPNGVYEELMGEALAAVGAEGAVGMAFGDLFLEDVRAYRERLLETSSLTAWFPLWGRPTGEVARDLIDAGVQAVLTCVDPTQVPRELIGRPFDADLLADLPQGADPCGEHGEFHTFVWDGPGFASPIDVEVGEVTERDGFVFCDVRPAG